MSEVERMLNGLSRNELNHLAKIANIPNYRKKKIAELRIELEQYAGINGLLKETNTEKFVKRFFNAHMYGILSIVIGLVGVALTVSYSSSVQSINESRNIFELAKERDVKAAIDRLLSSDTLVISEPHENRFEVDSIDLWDNSSYEIIEQSHTWDLRKWHHVPSLDLTELESPVTVRKRFLLKKTQSLINMEL